MAVHAWTILCEDATIDPETQNLSLREIIDEVQVQAPDPNVPVAIQANWKLVSYWRRSDPTLPESIVQRVRFIDPSGNATEPAEQNIALDPHLRARSIATLATLTLRGPGQYRFEIEHRSLATNEWQRDADVPLLVTYRS